MKKRCLISTAFFIGFFFLVGHAYAEKDFSALLGKVQTRYQNLQTLEAEFSQTSTRRNLMGNLEEVEQRGSVQIKKPGQLRWNYVSPEKKIYVTNGSIFWIYEAANQSATKGVWEPKSLALQFLIGEGDLQKDFEVRQLTESEATKHRVSKEWLMLIPKDPESMAGITTLLIDVDRKQHLITQAIVLDALESRTHWKFSKIKTNRVISNSVFNFTPPKGTRVK